MDLTDQKDSKKLDLITVDELLDEAEKEAEKFNLPRPNLAAEDTYGGGGEDDFRGRPEDGVEEVAAVKRFVSRLMVALALGFERDGDVGEEIMTAEEKYL